MNTNRSPRVAATYSFAVRSSPVATRQPGEAPRRAHLLLLVNETNGKVIGYGLTHTAPTSLSIRDWLLAEFKRPSAPDARPGRPRQLLGEDAALMQSLRFSLKPLGIEVSSADSLPALQRALDSLQRFLGAEDPSLSLVRLMGEDEALAFYRQAYDFISAQPWLDFESHDLLIFDSGPASRGVLIMGAGNEEFGLLMFASLEDAQQTLQGNFSHQLISVSLDSDALMHSHDLELLRRHGLFRAGQRVPVVVAPGTFEVSPESLAELRWLLSAVPQLVALEPVTEGAKSLRRFDEEYEDDEFALLLFRWGRHSQQAVTLADFLLASLPPGEADLDILEPIGRHYLKQTRKHKVQQEYFEVSSQDAWDRLKLSPTLRQRFDRVWMLLTQPAHPDESVQFFQTALPLLQEVANALAGGRRPEEVVSQAELVLLRTQLATGPHLAASLLGIFQSSSPPLRSVMNGAAHELLRLVHSDEV